jgi:PAS domain S-box-containing protein
MPLKGYYRNELERVDKASQRLREVMDGLSSAFFIGMMTVDGILTYANRTALEAIGLERKDVLGKPFVETPWWNYSEVTRQKLRDAITLAAKGEPSRFEAIFEDIHGELITTDFSLYPVLDAKGQVAYLVPSGHDVTERKAVERALQMLNACHEALLKAQDEIKLLEDVCQLIVDVGGYRLAWVGYAQHDEIKSIKPVAYVGEDKGLLSETVLTWAENDPRGQGASGQCLRTAEVVICEDIQQQFSVEYLRNIAKNVGLRGGISLPLKQNGRTFGVLTIASSSVFKVTDNEVNLLKKLAESVAYGVESLRARQQNQRILSAVYQIAEDVAVSTGLDYLKKLVLTMTATLGAHVGIITRLQNGSPPYTRTVVAVLDGQLIDNFDIPIDGTPCEKLNKETKEWIVSADVIKKYPLAEGLKNFDAKAYIGRRIENPQGDVMGQIFVLFREPLVETEYVSATLKIFTARVAAELERQGAA